MIIYGIHPVLAQLKSKPQNIRKLWITPLKKDGRLKEIMALAQQHRLPLIETSKEQLDQRCSNALHQGVLCELVEEQVHSFDFQSILQASLQKNQLILVLDGLTDPHNLGACLRSAEAFGVDAVLIPKDRAAQVNATVHKVSSGASQNIPVIPVTNLARSLTELKDAGFWIYGFAEEGEESLNQVQFTSPTVFVLGAEGTGLRRLTKEHCDFLVKIPMQGHVESLNVSVATGIALFELLRQRLSQSS